MSLAPKPVAVLQYLAENAGRVVTSEALLQAVWPDVHVSHAVLKNAISAVRAALSDTPGAHAFIETEPRRGYRFTGRVRTGNLPLPLTGFVGRCSELATVRKLLSRHRLVTVCGPPGCGKTRLAAELSRELMDEVPQGVWWVGLEPLADEAPLSDPTPLVCLVADTMGLSQRHGITGAPLVEFLAGRRALLVLDDCDRHLVAVAQLAHYLLSECEELRLLVTSRARLTVAGEQTVLLPPLDVPSDGALPAEALAADAVRLFFDRAAETRSSFAMSDQQVGSVAAICRRLDGLPLAIELAAARVSVLTVEEIAERLDDIFGLLSARVRAGCERHQTIQAAIDWTGALLSSDQRELLGQLAVFNGPFTLADVEAVVRPCQRGAPTAFELLARLVDCSLVAVACSSSSDRSSYRLLEPIRQYAASLQASSARLAGRDERRDQTKSVFQNS